MTHQKKHSETEAEPSFTEKIFQGEDPQEKIKEWTEDAKGFVEKNPWVAVAGALALGYVLGSMMGRRRGSE